MILNKKLFLSFTLLSFFLFLSQQSVGQVESPYDYTKAFSTDFYSNQGTAYRSASGKPGHKYWQNAANYKIKARLDTTKNEISGTLSMAYTNNSPDELEYIWMQMDQNLFQTNSIGASTVPLENSRYGDADSKFDGGFKLGSVQIDGQKDISYIVDDTRMRIDLPSPLKANGGKIEVTIQYSFIIPEYGADRTGILQTTNGPIYAIAQWYPRVAVYDDVNGWDTYPYTGPGEFYLEFGDFNIEITAPSNHIVVAGAELSNPSEVWTQDQLQRLEKAKNSNETVVIRSAEEVTDPKSRPQGSSELTWKFSLKKAHDISWASSAAFVIDAAKINLNEDRTALAMSAYPEESISNNGWERSTEYTKAAIEHYSNKWYEYPYPVAVNVASNVAGMEYPAISFCGHEARGEDLWGVTNHEFGHNWFPMIVGNNERLHGWLDEGLNTFINEIATQQFNKGEYDRPFGRKNRMSPAFMQPYLEPVMTTPQNMKERHIGILVYYKPAYGLQLLRDEIIGRDRFDLAFRNYIKHWAYKHPTPEDFFRTIENETGENLSWFWRGWFKENWEADMAIEDVSYVESDPQKGALITLANLGRLPLPVVIEATTESGKKTRKKLPVDIWQRDTVWQFKIDTQEELIKVQIDPDHVYPDINPKNNTWER